MADVRVRFAPSPTGELHVGGLRTALFNHLFAHSQKGRFILRIEDTDRERYVEGAEERLIDMLKWAGMTPDEGPGLGGDVGPYRQSERLPLYQEAAERLMAAGHAYKCYVTPEELEAMREDQIARGVDAKYDERHRNLTPDDHARFEAEGRKPVIRMRIPDREERIVVDDLIRGRVEVSTTQLDDQVLIKSDGFPTYHLAVVVDDHAMGITHVLRAEEWLPSTPKHLLLYRWLDYPPPQFAHLPLLLNADRSKMSKRSGDTAAEDYRAKGYLPDALVNFLALLGWNPGDDQELFERAELLGRFSLERVGKAGSVFDLKKLEWMNQVYIGKLPPEELHAVLGPFIAQTPYAGEDEQLLRDISLIVQPQLITLADIGKHLPLFFHGEDTPLDPELEKNLAGEDAQRVLAAFRDGLAAMDHLDPEVFGALMKQVQKETKIKGRGLWGTMRWAITRQAEGPDLAKVAAVFGKAKTIARVEKVLAG